MKPILGAVLFMVASAFVTNAQQAPNWATDPQLTPQVREFLKAVNAGPGLETLSPDQARLVLVNAQASVKVDVSGIDESEKTIVSDGFTIKLNLVRPAGVKAKLPVIIFIHGGGWVLGDYPTHKRLVRDIVVGSGFAVVFVNYTRTPDAQYPVAINEIYAATKWVAEHGDEINVDGKNLAVVGNSVGGNMTAVTCLKAKDNNGPKIKVAVMMWPVTNAVYTDASWLYYGQGRYLTAAAMKWMWDLYIPDAAKRLEVYASPLQASLEGLRGLPPTLILVDENDILRDEGEAYGRKLVDAGVTSTTVRYNGVIHDWGLLNGLATIPQTRDLIVQVSGELKKYLK
ncbi:MAG: alpha/beta hydrolase [Chitinophagaceae bacterium]